MIGHRNFTKNPIFLYEGLKWYVTKTSPIITQRSSWCVKPHKYVLIKKLNYHLGIISRRGNSFYPLENVINRHEVIKIIGRRRKWSHKVDSFPNVKTFYLKNPTLMYPVPSKNVPWPLASITTDDKGSGIFKESGPIEIGLKQLSYSLVGSKMCTKSWGMVMVEDTSNLTFWHTSSMYSIPT